MNEDNIQLFWANVSFNNPTSAWVMVPAVDAAAAEAELREAFKDVNDLVIHKIGLDSPPGSTPEELEEEMREVIQQAAAEQADLTDAPVKGTVN